MNHIELGKAGEKLAVNHLTSKGHEILTTNYRFKKSEVDIVSMADNFLVITEVKTRVSEAFGQPYLSVNRSKQRQIIKVSNHYISENNIENEMRFDVISIILNQNRMKLEHIEDAFYPL